MSLIVLPMYAPSAISSPHAMCSYGGLTSLTWQALLEEACGNVDAACSLFALGAKVRLRT